MPLPPFYRRPGKIKVPFKWCPPELLPRKMWDKATTSYEPIFNEMSDMWAFGVVCWEVASYGVVPFRNQNLLKVLKAIDMDGLRLAWPEGADLDLKALSLRACAESNHDRPTFQTVSRELAAKLQDAAAGGAVQDLGALLNPPRREVLRKSSMTVAALKQAHWQTLMKAAMLFKKGLHKNAASTATVLARTPAPVPSVVEEDDDDVKDDGGSGGDAGLGSTPAVAVVGGSSAPTLRGDSSHVVQRRQSIQLDNPETVMEAFQPKVKRPVLYDESSWVLGDGGNVERRQSSFAAAAEIAKKTFRIALKPFQRGALFEAGLFNRFHAFHVDSSDDDESGDDDDSQSRSGRVQWRVVTGSTGATSGAAKAAAEIESSRNAPLPKAKKGVRFQSDGTMAGGEADGNGYGVDNNDAVAVQDTSPHFAGEYDDDDDASIGGGGGSCQGRVAQPWYTDGIGPHGTINTFGNFPKVIKLVFRARNLASGANYAVVTRCPKTTAALISDRTARRAPKPVQVCKTESAKRKSTDVKWKPIKVTPETLCGGRHDIDAQLKLAVFSSSWGGSGLVGEATLSLQEILEAFNPDGTPPLPLLPLSWKLFNAQKSGSEQAGVLELVSFEIVEVGTESTAEPAMWKAQSPQRKTTVGKFPAWV